MFNIIAKCYKEEFLNFLVKEKKIKNLRAFLEHPDWMEEEIKEFGDPYELISFRGYKDDRGNIRVVWEGNDVDLYNMITFVKVIKYEK